MAADVDTDRWILERIPEGLPLGEARTAWLKRAEVAAMMAKGKETRQILPATHITKRGLEWIMPLIEANGGAPPSATPGAPRAAPPAVPVARTHTPKPEPPQGALMGPDPGPTQPDDARTEAPPAPAERPAAPSLTVGQHGGSSPLQPQAPSEPGAAARRVLQAEMAAMTLGDVGDPLKPSPLAGPFEAPDFAVRLAEICRMHAIQPEKARGIAVSFSYENPKDTRRLHEIVMAMGVPPAAADNIVRVYKSMNRSLFDRDDGGEASGDQPGAPTLEQIETRMGIKPGQPVAGIEGQISDLARQETELRIENLKLALQEKRKSMGLPVGGQQAQGEDDTVEIVLNVNGVPFPRRIKASQLPLYQAYMSPPGSQPRQGQEEMPAWARAQADQLAALLRDREEDRRRRDEEDRLRNVVGPLQDKIKELEEKGASNRTAQEDAVLKELREMRERQADADRKHQEERFDRLERSLGNLGSPAALADMRTRAEAIGRSVDMVPKLEALQLSQEQLDLEAQRKANSRKDEATGRTIEIIGKRVDEHPVERIIKSTGLDQVVPDIVKRQFSTEAERAGYGTQPTEAELAAAALALERQNYDAAPAAPQAAADERPAARSTGRIQ